MVYHLFWLITYENPQIFSERKTKKDQWESYPQWVSQKFGFSSKLSSKFQFNVKIIIYLTHPKCLELNRLACCLLAKLCELLLLLLLASMFEKMLPLSGCNSWCKFVENEWSQPPWRQSCHLADKIVEFLSLHLLT